MSSMAAITIVVTVAILRRLPPEHKAREMWDKLYELRCERQRVTTVEHLINAMIKYEDDYKDQPMAIDLDAVAKDLDQCGDAPRMP